jgi:hypothetical protein
MFRLCKVMTRLTLELLDRRARNKLELEMKSFLALKKSVFLNFNEFNIFILIFYFDFLFWFVLLF